METSNSIALQPHLAPAPNEIVYLQKEIEGVFVYAKTIAPQSSSVALKQLVIKVASLFQQTGLYCLSQIGVSLTQELDVSLKDPKVIEERINLLHFIYYHLLPIFAESKNEYIGFSRDEIERMVKAALINALENIPDELHDLLPLYSEIRIHIALPQFYSPYIDFVATLNALKENVKHDSVTTKYTLARFKENLKFLLNKTVTFKTPISSFDETLNKYLEQLFLIISYLKYCHKREEALELLMDVSLVLKAIGLKLNEDDNDKNIKLFGDKLEYLASLALKIKVEIENQNAGLLPPINKAALTINKEAERGLKDTVDLLFSSDIASILENPKILAYFENEATCVKISWAVSERIIFEMEKWMKSGETRRCTNVECLLKYQKCIDLNLFFIKTVLANRPSLNEERLDLLANFYAQTNYYFGAVSSYIKIKNDYNEEIEGIFGKVERYHSEILALTHEANLFVQDRTAKRKDNRKTQAERQYYSQQLFKICVNALNNKIYYTYICIHLNKLDLVKTAYSQACETYSDVITIIDSLDEQRVSESKKLMVQTIARLQEIKKIVEAHDRIKALMQPDDVGVIYTSLDLNVHVADIKKMLDHFTETTSDVLATSDNAVYDKLNNHYSAQFKVRAIRQAVITFLMKSHGFTYEDKTTKQTLSQDRWARLKELQSNINVIYAGLKTVGTMENERFPNKFEYNLLINSLFTNILFHALEAEVLLLKKGVREGKYSKLYAQANANFQVFLEIGEVYKTLALNDENKAVVKIKSIFELYGAFRFIFYHFANVDFYQLMSNKSLLLLEEIHSKNILSFEELRECIVDINDYEQSMPFHLFLHKNFVSLSFKVTNIKNLLGNLIGKSSGAFLANKQGQVAFEKRLEELQNDNLTVLELADIILTLNKDFGIHNLNCILEKLSQQLQNRMKACFEEKIGISGATAEIINIILLDIKKCRAMLQQKIKQEEIIKAKKQEQQAQLRKMQEEKARIKKLQEQNKKLNKLNRRQQHETQFSSEIAEREPMPVKMAKKPSQRLKTQKELSVEEPNDWVTDYFRQEKRQSRQQSITQSAQQKERERQKKIEASKAAKALEKQRIKERLENERYQQDLIDEAKLKEVVIKRTLQEEERQRNEQLEKTSSHLAEELLDEVVKEIAKMTLAEDEITLLFSKVMALNSEGQTFRQKDLHVSLDNTFHDILARFNKEGIRAYLYGGYPRDKLLNRQPRDGDIVVFCSKEEAQVILGSDCVVNYNSPDKQLVYEGVDIRCEDKALSLAEFSKQLDFTINALMVDHKGDVFAPIASSVDDLKRTALYTIINASESFAQDPRRIYRCINQSFSLFATAPVGYDEAITENAHKLTALPLAAYRKNFLNLFRQGHAKKTLKYLSRANLLKSLIPALKPFDIDKDDLSWFINSCQRIDQTDSLRRKEEFNFNQIISFFLAPLINKKMQAQEHLEIQLIIDETIEALFLPFEEKLDASQRRVLSANLNRYYAEYNHHIHQRIHQRKIQPKLPLSLSAPGRVFVPRYANNRDSMLPVKSQVSMPKPKHPPKVI